MRGNETEKIIIVCMFAWTHWLVPSKVQCPGFPSLHKVAMCWIHSKWNRHRYDNFHFLTANREFPFISRGILEPYVGRVASWLPFSNPYSFAFKILISPWMSLQFKVRVVQDENEFIFGSMPSTIACILSCSFGVPFYSYTWWFTFSKSYVLLSTLYCS